MNKERTIKEIEENQHPILKDTKEYQVIRCQYDEDFIQQKAHLIITIRNKNNKETINLRFENVCFNESPFLLLRDSCGLYLIDTSYLGYNSDQKVEVGDWDGGPPIFWAEKVEKIKE